MALVARASKTVRNKNLIIVAMCVLFLGWFAYDGYYTYPTRNDRLVKSLVLKEVDLDRYPLLSTWQGWEKESPAHRADMDAIIRDEKRTTDLADWKEIFDISLQRYIVWALVAAVGGSIGWFMHCQKRRAIAEEATVSPSPGVVIPWEKITIVDNTRWQSAGIVDITYTDAQGVPRKAKFDDYELEREPLLEILDRLAERATQADFIPKIAPVVGESAGEAAP